MLGAISITCIVSQLETMSDALLPSERQPSHARLNTRRQRTPISVTSTTTTPYQSEFSVSTWPQRQSAYIHLLGAFRNLAETGHVERHDLGAGRDTLSFRHGCPQRADGRTMITTPNKLQRSSVLLSCRGRNDR